MTENKTKLYSISQVTKILDLKTQKEIEANFKNEMSKLNYV